MLLLKTFFFGFEACLGLFGAPLGRFGVNFGVPGGFKKGSKIKRFPTRPGILGPSGLQKASWDNFGWISRGLELFFCGFAGDSEWFWLFCGRAFSTTTTTTARANATTTTLTLVPQRVRRVS